MALLNPSILGSVRRVRAVLCGLCGAAALLASPGFARADVLETFREAPVRELVHDVRFAREDHVGVFTVRRVVVHDGAKIDTVRLVCGLPGGGSVTGLRLRTRSGSWREARLRDGDAALEWFRGSLFALAREPAVRAMMRSDQGRGVLMLAGVASGERVEVEYTVRVVMERRDQGAAYATEYPRPLADPRFADVVVRHDDAQAHCAATVTGRPLTASGRRLKRVAVDPERLVYPEESAEIVARAPWETSWRARVGRVSVSEREEWVRVEVEVSPRLSAVPRVDRVVFVLDTSYSSADTLPRQLEVVRAYMERVPDARVQLVTSHRAPTYVLDAFVSREALDAALAEPRAQAALIPAHGSDVPAALGLAQRALEQRAGLHRVVVFTDGQLPRARAEAQLERLGKLARGVRWDMLVLSGHALHRNASTVVVGKPAPLFARRDDDHPLGRAVQSHGGVLLKMPPSPAPETARFDIDRLTARLLRPTQLEGMTLRGLRGRPQRPLPDTLAEGDRWSITHTQPPQPNALLAVRALMDHTPLVAQAHDDSARDAALWFLQHDPERVRALGADALARVSWQAQAATGATALVVSESDDPHSHRPFAPTLAFNAQDAAPRLPAWVDREHARRERIAAWRRRHQAWLNTRPWHRGGSFVGRNVGNVEERATKLRRVEVRRPDADLVDIDAVVQPFVQRCRAHFHPDRAFDIRMETYGVEIVDMWVEGPESAWSRCIVDGLWRLRLPQGSAFLDNFTYRVPLPWRPHGGPWDVRRYRTAPGAPEGW